MTSTATTPPEEWKPSPADLDYAKRFGNLRYDPKYNPIDYRGQTPRGQAYKSQYGDSVNELGYMFGDNDPTTLLPQNYLSGVVRKGGKDKPLRTTDRYKAADMKPLSGQEEELVDKYNQYQREFTAPNAEYVLGMGLPREEHTPLSQAERRELAKKTRIEREKMLQKKYPDYDDRLTALDAVRRSRKIKQYQKEQAERYYHDPMTGKRMPVDEQYRMRRRALQNIGGSLQGAITQPQYTGLLALPWVRGYDPDQDPNDPQEYKKLRGYSLQTLPPEERQRLMVNLYKTIAILNATPVHYDALESVEGAKQMYNEKDYAISVTDADDNILTPGIVVVQTKRDSYNKGQFIPAGSYVSIGGWTLADASEARSLERLKDMMYYQQFPTKNARSLNKRSDFIGAVFGSRKDTGGERGLKLISQMLRKLYEAEDYFIPQRVRAQSGQFMDVPTYMQIWAYSTPKYSVYRQCLERAVALGHVDANADLQWAQQTDPADEGKEKPVVTLKLSTPVFNTFISWVAKLFFNMIMLVDEDCPFKINTDNVGVNGVLEKSVAANALAHGIAGEEILNIEYDPDPSTNRYKVSFKEDNPIQYGKPDPPNDWGKMPDATGRDALVQIHELWNKSYFDDTALTAILRDEYVSTWIEHYCNSILDNMDLRTEDGAEMVTSLVDKMSELGHVILYHTMNSSIQDHLDDIVQMAVTEENYNSMYRRYAYAYSANLHFLKRAECQRLVERSTSDGGTTYAYSDFNIAKIHNVTKKVWTNVIAECRLSRRCYTWVGKSVKALPIDQRVLMPTSADYEVRPDDGTKIAQLFHTKASTPSLGNLYAPPQTENDDWAKQLDKHNPYDRAGRERRNEYIQNLINSLSGTAPPPEEEEEEEEEAPAAAAAQPSTTTTTTTTSTSSSSSSAPPPLPFPPQPRPKAKRAAIPKSARPTTSNVMTRSQSRGNP